MARNRKYRTAAVRFGAPVKAFLLCLLIGGSGIGYVWQKSQIDDLGKQILKRERRLKELDDQNNKLSEQLAKMRGPFYLNFRIKDLKLGLVQAPLSQVCRLPEPPREPPSPPAEAQYAAQAAAPAILP
jgi:hypothetical protein